MDTPRVQRHGGCETDIDGEVSDEYDRDYL